MEQNTFPGSNPVVEEPFAEVRRKEILLQAGALQDAIFNSANFSSIATDARGVIQIFNVGAERMLGYTAADVVDKITPADISDPKELFARSTALSVELRTTIAPGFEALVFKASRGIEDIYDLTYIRKDGSRFPATVSVTALRDAEGGIIGYLLIGTDNTARKRAEQDRKRLFALSQDMLCILGFDGFFKDLNPAWERTLGYTKAEMLAVPFIGFIHPDDLEITLAEAANIEAGESLSGFENRYLCLDGSYRWFEWSVTPVIEDQVMYGVARDVTERKQVEAERVRAEEARRTSEARYRVLFECAPDGIVIADPDGVYLEANGSICKMLGYQHDELIGLPSSRIVAEKEFEHIAPALREILAKPPYHREWHFRRKDHSTFDAEVIATTMPDGNVLAMIRDITDRNNAERALKASFKDITDLKRAQDEHDIVAITDPRGVITYVNEKFCAISKYSREELLGQDLRLINSGFHSREFMRNMWNTIRDGRVWKGEIRNRAKDGTFYWVDSTIVPFLGEDGKPVQYIAIRADITERKRFEQELQTSLADRELLLREIQHRVKNNMQMVCSLLQLQARHAQNPVMSAILHESQNRVRSMALIHEKLYGGDSLARIDLADYLRSLAAMIQRSHSDRAGVELRFEVVPLTSGMDTAVPLGLAVNELLTNAFKHAFPAAVRGAMTAPEIVIVLQPEANGRLRLEVRDNGVGMPENFAPETNGSLGMRLVQIFAKQLHCELHWSSGNGGSVFQMCFRELQPKRPQPIDHQPDLSL